MLNSSCGDAHKDTPEFIFDRVLLPLKVGGIWGFVDHHGTVKIKPQFKEASEFCNGYAVVKSGDKFGLIAPSGRFNVQPIYDQILDINSENLVGVCMGNCAYDSNGGRWGFADVRTGALKVQLQFTTARSFTEHLAAVCSGQCNDTYDAKTYKRTEASGKWGFIDPSGAWVVSPQFDSAQSFHEGVAGVTLGIGENAKSGYIDFHGAFVAGPSS